MVRKRFHNNILLLHRTFQNDRNVKKIFDVLSQY